MTTAPAVVETTTTPAPETTTPEMMQSCALPLEPAGIFLPSPPPSASFPSDEIMNAILIPLQSTEDPDINLNSGTRFGNVKFSRFQYDSLPGKTGRIWDKSEMSIEFKTSEPDGIIFYAGEKEPYVDHITVYLKGGSVHFSFNSGSGHKLLNSSGTYADDEWHTVTFHRHGKKGTLYVDDVLVAEGSSNGNTLGIEVIPPIYVGGVSPEILTKASRNFEVKLHPHSISESL